jgi:hypothetical protein
MQTYLRVSRDREARTIVLIREVREGPDVGVGVDEAHSKMAQTLIPPPHSDVGAPVVDHGRAVTEVGDVSCRDKS